MDLNEPLSALIASARDSIGALVVDEEGETIELLGVGAQEDDLRLLGAYLGLQLRRLGKGLEGIGAGQALHLDQDRGSVRCHVRRLPHDYSLVLIQKRPALSGEARRQMEAAAGEIARRLFPETAGE